MSSWIVVAVICVAFVLGMAAQYAYQCSRRLKSRALDLEVAVQVQKDLFAGVAETCPVGILVIALDGSISFANAAAERILCMGRNELSALTYRDDRLSLHEQLGGPIPIESHPVSRVLAAAESVIGKHYGIECPGDERRLVSVNAAPLRDSSRNLSGVIVTLEDITEQSRSFEALSASERRLRTTMDGMMEGCQIIGRDLRYLYLNDSVVRHARKPREEMLGKTMPDVWPGIEGTEAFARIRAALDEGLQSRMENRFEYPDGTVGWFNLEIQPVPEGVFILSVDTTERRLMEDELRRHKGHLEELVDERTVELARATRAKSDFLASMSHELRTPLNSIIGFSDLLVSGIVGPLLPEQQKQIGMINGAGRHLLALINDVLDLSKIEAGYVDVRPEELDARGAVSQVVEMLRPLADAKNLDMQLWLPETLCEISTDAEKFRQILLNIIGNALKFTDDGVVAVKLDSDSGRGVVISVTDTGPGIPADDISRIFDAFSQSKPLGAMKPEGTGLGLTISRRYARLLGGDIYVESVVGEGSTFILVLPLECETIPPLATSGE